MYKVKEASGDAYIYTKSREWREAIWVKDVQRYRERTEEERQWQRRRRKVGAGGGVQCSSGLMIYSTRFFEITSGREGKKWRRETEWKDWRFEANLAAAVSRVSYVHHVFRGHLITTRHRTAWNSGWSPPPTHTHTRFPHGGSGLQTGVRECGRQWQPL